MQNDPYYLVYVSIESDRNSLKYYKYNKITAAEHHVFIGVFNTNNCFFLSCICLVCYNHISSDTSSVVNFSY